MFYQHFYFVTILTLTTFWGFSEECTLPSQLLYQGKPIPETILERFFGSAVMGCEYSGAGLDITKSLNMANESEWNYTSFEWNYIGFIHKDLLVVRAYIMEKCAICKFSGILILKREGDLLKIVDIIYGGTRHSSTICEWCQIKHNRIVFYQGATTGSIVDKAIELYPEVAPIYEKSKKVQIGYGEACYYGTFQKTAEITSEGKIVKIDLMGFTPCEGCYKEEELYRKGGLKAIALDLLTYED